MKKFHFSLETVLDYKQQILASLQAEHGAILAQVREQERLIEELEAEYQQMDGEFAQRKLEGIAILDAMKYEQYLRAMERQIQLARRPSGRKWLRPSRTPHPLRSCGKRNWTTIRRPCRRTRRP